MGGKRQPSGSGDPEAYAANFHMEYRRSADYIQCQLYLASLVAASWLCLCLGRHTLKYYVKEMLQLRSTLLSYTVHKVRILASMAAAVRAASISLEWLTLTLSVPPPLS